MRPIVDPATTRLNELAGRDRGGMPKDGYQIALPAGFDAQRTEAVLGVGKRYSVDRTSQDLSRARRRCPRHPGMMDMKIRGR